MDCGVATNIGGACGGLRSCSGAMAAVVIGCWKVPVSDDNRASGRDGRRWLSREDSLTDGMGEEGKRKRGARVSATPKTAREIKNWYKDSWKRWVWR